jgi:hypothetical protein
MLPLSKLRKDPIIVLGGMIVALTIMIGAGFAFLYFKSELDVKQMSNEIGIIREMLLQKSRLEHRNPNRPSFPTPCVNVHDRVCATAEEAAAGIAITADIQPKDFCRAKTTCEIQSDGKCGWTSTPEYEACLLDPPKPPYN